MPGLAINRVAEGRGNTIFGEDEQDIEEVVGIYH